MTMNKELEAGLRVMAEDFHLPAGGRKKLSQLVAGHLDWFDAAERRGMGWRDMIRALTAAGVTSRRGKPLSVGTLSSAVWRKRAETEDASCAGRQAPPAPPEPAPLHPRLPKERQLSPGQPPRDKRGAVRSLDDQGEVSRQSPAPSKRTAREARGQNSDVLAFMDRTRAVRQRSK